MNSVRVVAAVLVGVAFVVAGASKLAAGDAWPPQARALGAPVWTIKLVPWIELGLGALLIVQLARRPAAIAALLLVCAFTLLIVRRLLAGDRPACACFGAWSAKPIGVGHLARNAALATLALIAAL